MGDLVSRFEALRIPIQPSYRNNRATWPTHSSLPTKTFCHHEKKKKIADFVIFFLLVTDRILNQDSCSRILISRRLENSFCIQSVRKERVGHLIITDLNHGFLPAGELGPGGSQLLPQSGDLRILHVGAVVKKLMF